MTSPFQPKDKLMKVIYKAADNQRLQYDTPNSFPILSVINAYADNNEEIEVIVIVHDYDNSRENLNTFKEQLDELLNKKGIILSGHDIRTINIKFSEELDNQLELFEKISDCITDGDTMYCCMSYGTKAVPVIEMMALNYVYNIRKDISIGCLVYGSFDFQKKETYLYDITSLFYMNKLIEGNMVKKSDDPKKVIKMLLGKE